MSFEERFFASLGVMLVVLFGALGLAATNKTWPFDQHLEIRSRACPPRPGAPYLEGTAGLNHVAMNAQVETPVFGDERHFLSAQRIGIGPFYDVLNVVPGDELTVRLYINNAADTKLPDSSATGLSARLTTRPLSRGKAWIVRGYLDAANASPRFVSDDAVIKSTSYFTLVPIDGSGRLVTNYFVGSGVELADSVFGSGVRLGTKSLDGIWLAGFQGDGWLTVRYRVHASKRGVDNQPSWDCDI